MPSLKTGFDFSRGCNYDHPEISAQLFSYQYRGKENAPVAPIPEYSPFNWSSDVALKEEGVLSHKDFTPGRNYFEQALLYFDDDYVLITYTPSPAKNSKRYLQCLNAHTSAILFTSLLDDGTDNPPDECVRYQDGFAMSGYGKTFHVTLSGKIREYKPAW